MTKTPNRKSQMRAAAKHRLKPLYLGIQEVLPLGLRRQFVHLVRHRQYLHLKEPRTFNEKLSWRMVYDRCDALKLTCDKKAMKVLAHERAGDLVRVPRTIWSGRDLRELTEVDLPQHWVLKPNHRSGIVYFGQGHANTMMLTQITSGWLDEVNWRIRGEWAYAEAEPTFLVEEVIGVPGTPPTDYKFEVFDGVARMVGVYHGRFDGLRANLFDRNFEPLGVRFATIPPLTENEVVKPRNYDRMLEAAERISAGFDYLRVDMYDTGDEAWFGETTPYSGGGGYAFHPRSYDLVLGSYWTLPERTEPSRHG